MRGVSEPTSDDRRNEKPTPLRVWVHLLCMGYARLPCGLQLATYRESCYASRGHRVTFALICVKCRVWVVIVVKVCVCDSVCLAMAQSDAEPEARLGLESFYLDLPSSMDHVRLRRLRFESVSPREMTPLDARCTMRSKHNTQKAHPVKM